jgi:hypothetical protein
VNTHASTHSKTGGSDAAHQALCPRPGGRTLEALPAPRRVSAPLLEGAEEKRSGKSWWGLQPACGLSICVCSAYREPSRQDLCFPGRHGCRSQQPPVAVTNTRRTKRERERCRLATEEALLCCKRCRGERTARVLGATGSELTPTRNPEAGGGCGASMTSSCGKSKVVTCHRFRGAVIGDGCDRSNIAVRILVISQTASCPQFIAMPQSASSARSTAPAKHPFAHWM